MKANLSSLFILLVVTALGGCSTMSVQKEDIVKTVDRKFNEFCSLSDSPEPSREDHIKRAKIILAAVAGYGYRSMQNYSRLSDIGIDANTIITKVNDAYAQIGTMETQKASGLFPVYRADVIVELSEAAGAAISPTLRAAKRSVVAASVSERLATAKNALTGLLEDELYYSAYQEACHDFAGIKDTDLTTRIAGRCDELYRLSLLVKAPAIECKVK